MPRIRGAVSAWVREHNNELIKNKDKNCANVMEGIDFIVCDDFFATSQTPIGCLTVDEEINDQKGLQEGSNGEPLFPSVTDADLLLCAKYKDLGESYGYCV